MSPTEVVPRGARIAAGRVPQLILLGSLGFLAITGLVESRGYNLLSTQNAIEVVFIVTALGLGSPKAFRVQVLLFVVTAYFLSKLLLMILYQPASAFDFIQAYKAY